MKNLFRTGILLSFCLIALTSMTFKPKHIIFFGDSITQQGVSKNGYVTLIKKALDSTKYAVTGAGIGGNKIYDLYLRLEDDVLNKKPDLVVIYVGINDVWHKQSSHTGTDYDKYLKFYQALINKIQGVGSKVILVTPSVVGEKKDGTNELDADLNKYAEGIRKLAAKNNLPVCDLRKIFTEYEAKNNPEDKEKGILTTDRVHLNEAGNKLVADQLLPLVR
ncbi:G-D-S-L family lipolytic protein [Pedobacter sp. Leaf41]|uniref:SGNH/GDSL hydrolase family protein n=1 Tax=Pedobacter sp. Leaf41 TaxID=1736218 RepID=UPI00070271A7|nr:SGNH/GDSL hydrolase family protein [Pedobacter sp. Leaf41]KQN39076.1 G-D-S-L family lipolytic protein [Pedobacter sp. Leaf41]